MSQRVTRFSPGGSGSASLQLVVVIDGLVVRAGFPFPHDSARARGSNPQTANPTIIETFGITKRQVSDTRTLATSHCMPCFARRFPLRLVHGQLCRRHLLPETGVRWLLCCTKSCRSVPRGMGSTPVGRWLGIHMPTCSMQLVDVVCLISCSGRKEETTNSASELCSRGFPGLANPAGAASVAASAVRLA